MAVKQSGDAVRVDGLRELRRFLRNVGDDVAKDGLKRIHKQVAKPVKAEALRRVPVRTGNLRASVRIGKRSERAAVIRAGFKRVPYAGPIHFGWPNRRVVFGNRTGQPSPIAAQPFLTDALEDRRDEVADIYLEELERFLGWLMNKYNLEP